MKEKIDRSPAPMLVSIPCFSYDFFLSPLEEAKWVKQINRNNNHEQYLSYKVHVKMVLIREGTGRYIFMIHF